MIEMRTNNRRGFTLVEMLIVLAMLGAVMAAVYSLYTVHSRSASTQDEVVEVQQNLRIAMDEITRDIKMAGFLVPYAGADLMPAIQNAVDGAEGGPDAITFNTASASGRYARIDQAVTSDVSTVFVLDSPEAVDPFVNTDDKVRIIRAKDRTEPSAGPFAITGVNREAHTITIMTNAGVSYAQDDMIVGTTAASRPDVLQYCIGPASACGNNVTTCPQNQKCLMKIENGISNPIAGTISDFQLRYLMKDNTEVDAPGDLGQIRAVRVTITGQTAAITALSGEAVKKRQVVSIVKVRN